MRDDTIITEESSVKRKPIILIAICILLSLCGCSDTSEDSALSFFDAVSEAESIAFEVKLRAEYSDKTAEFELAYAENNDGVSVTVIKPESIAGISAKLSDDNVSLNYDGAILNMGALSDNGLCPMSALPITVMAMKNAYLDSAWSEGDMTVLRLIPSDDRAITLWLDSELTPCNAEISCDGSTVVFIEFDGWEMN